MDMDTDALRWLQQVADGTTVTEVSELEAVTQSGVSRALARLEEQIGTPLLRRSGRTLRMTHAGAVPPALGPAAQAPAGRQAAGPPGRRGHRAVYRPAPGLGPAPADRRPVRPGPIPAPGHLLRRR